MRQIIILQARLASSRFPNKVLADLTGKPVIAHIVERLRLAQRADDVCVAIPIDVSDDPLAETLQGLGACVTRGSSNDVLSRYIQAAYETDAQVIVRATADNPLVEWGEVDRQIDTLLSEELDYVSTDGYPRGVTVETFTLKTLEKLDFLARQRDHREHVTLHLRQSPGPFNVRHLEAPAELNHPEWSLSIDRAEDLRMINAIYERLGSSGPVETAAAIKLLSEEPELLQLREALQAVA